MNYKQVEFLYHNIMVLRDQDLIYNKLLEVDMKIYLPEEALKKVSNIEGIICPSCGSGNIYVTTKQIRSADEPETQIFECLDCGSKWKKN